MKSHQILRIFFWLLFWYTRKGKPLGLQRFFLKATFITPFTPLQTLFNCPCMYVAGNLIPETDLEILSPSLPSANSCHILRSKWCPSIPRSIWALACVQWSTPMGRWLGGTKGRLPTMPTMARKCCHHFSFCMGHFSCVFRCSGSISWSILDCLFHNFFVSWASIMLYNFCICFAWSA